MQASLICIVEDGSTPSDGTLPRVASQQDIEWPVGYGGPIALTVQHADGTAFDLAGCTVDLVARKHAADATPALAYSAVIDPTPTEPAGPAPGTATVTFLDADTALLTSGVVYWMDVRLTTAETPPAEWQIVLPSKLMPLFSIARAGEPPEGG